MPSLGYYRPIRLFQIVLDFPHLRITSGGWARGSRTTLTRKINDTLPRLPHHVFQCCLLSGLLNGRVTGAWTEKRATMPSHRTGFAPSTTGFLTFHLSEGLPPKIAVPTYVPGSKPRRDHARAWERNDRARQVRFGCFFSSDDPRVSLGRGIARVRPAFDARLAPRRSRDEGGAPNRRDPVRDARQRAEAVRRRKLQGDVRQARAGPRPLQGASRSASRSVPMSDSRTRSSASDPRVAPSSSRRARRRADCWHPNIFKNAPRDLQLRDLVPTAPSSKLAAFPPRDSTGKGGVSRRGRRVLPLRAPRRQPHRQGGRRPRLLETAEEDARVHSSKAGLTRS